jgi:erythromycin esterase-like protein
MQFKNRREVDHAAVELIRHWSEPLPEPELDSMFGAAFDRFGAARVVLLGEATHGSSEFYRARAAITRRLIERHGFSIVAVEADWPDAATIDAAVGHRGRTTGLEADAFTRFPTWMWRNAEIEAFTDWLREHNAGLQPAQRVEFRGLDLYSLGASIRAVLRFLDETDPDEAREARARYACLTPWQADPAQYARAVSRGKHSCEDNVVEELCRLLDHRIEYHQRDNTHAGREATFDAVQNARVVEAAEHYYRSMFNGFDSSWNLRDRHMFDTLRRVLEARSPEAKAVVWAHNSHVGNASATAMGWHGQFNIGELCRTAFGPEAALIGFGTDRGTVAAADDWDEPMQIKQVVPARGDSYERLFRQAGRARSLTHWVGEERRRLREVLAEPRQERAIGVVYRPDTELQSHYFRAILAEQFDAWVWFEETSAVTALPLPNLEQNTAPDATATL